MNHVVRTLSAMLMLAVFAPGTSFAQDARLFELSGGYSFARASNSFVGMNFNGWIASATGNLSPIFGITGEIGGSYRSIDPFGNGNDLLVTLHSFLAGPRVNLRAATKVTLFGQFLVGAHRFGLEGASATDFAIQPGVGVDFWTAPNVAVRLGADYRRTFRSGSRRLLIFEGNSWNQFVVHVGGVVAPKM